MSAAPARPQVSQHPLTGLQTSMVFHRLGGAEDGVDVEQIVCLLPEAVDAPRLEAAWAAVIARHDSLRGVVRLDDPQGPMLSVAEALDVPLDVIDLSTLAPEQREAEFALALADDRLIGFDLDVPPLVRLTLYRFGPMQHRLVWTFPHVLLDGRSFGQVLGEVFTRYDANGTGDHTLLPEVPQFRTFVDWLKEHEQPAANREFWVRTLAGVELPTPLAPLQQGGGEDGWGDLELRLPALTSEAVRGLGADIGVGVSTIVAGAYALALSGPRGREVVFGSARGRRRGTVADADFIVGCFLNVLPTRVRLPRGLPVDRWLQQLRAEQREVAPHEHATLADIRHWLGLPKERPTYEALLIFDTQSIGAEMRLRGGPWVNRWAVLLERTGVPLTLYAYAEGRLHLRLTYDRRRCPDAAAAQLLQSVAGYLSAMPDGAERPIGELTPSSGVGEAVPSPFSAFPAKTARTSGL